MNAKEASKLSDQNAVAADNPTQHYHIMARVHRSVMAGLHSTRWSGVMSPDSIKKLQADNYQVKVRTGNQQGQTVDISEIPDRLKGKPALHIIMW